MGDSGRHGRNVGWLALADVFGKAISIFYFAYLSRKLSIVENGWYGTFIVFVPILTGINALGLQDIVTREVAQRRERVHHLMGMGTVAQLAAFVLIVPSAWLVTGLLNYAYGLRVIVLLAAVAALERTLIGMQTGILAAYEKFKYVSIITMAVRSAAVSGGILLLFFGYGLMPLLALILVVYAAELLFSYAVARVQCARYRWRIDFGEGPMLLYQGSRMAVMRFLGTAYYHMDLPVMNAVATPEMTGYYAIGTRFILVLWTLSNLVESVAYPVLSRKAIDTEEAQFFVMGRLIKLMAIISFPIAVGMTVLSADIVVTLCGAKYAPGAIAVAALTWILAFHMLMRPADLYLRAKALQNRVGWCYACAFAFKAGLSLYVIPRYGITGFIVLNLAATSVLFVAMNTVAMRVLPLLTWRHIAALLARPFLAAAIMGLSVLFLRGQTILLSVPVGVAAYGIAVLALGVLDDVDKDLIWSAIRR